MNFKNIMMKSFLLVSLLTFSLMITSCEKDVDIDMNTNFSTTTKEATFLKEKLRAQLPILKTLVSNNEKLLKSTIYKSENINKELSILLSELSSESLCMLESYGIFYDDIEQYVDNIDDPRISIIGMVFIAFQEKGISNNIIRLKSGSTEEDEFSYAQVMDCLGRAFLGINIADFVFGSATKFTMATALGIAGRVASRTLGLVGAAVAIADFGDCMGWYDMW